MLTKPLYDSGVTVSRLGHIVREERFLESNTGDEIALLDPLDVVTRLEELRQLEDGWLDGDGQALPPEGLEWLINCFGQFFSGDTPFPYICPTEEGGVCLEWPFDTKNFSLEIDLDRRLGYWHTLNEADNSYEEKEIDLNLPESWYWFCEQVKQGGVS